MTNIFFLEFPKQLPKPLLPWWSNYGSERPRDFLKGQELHHQYQEQDLSLWSPAPLKGLLVLSTAAMQVI